jgi:DNA polymerase V
VYHKAGVVAYPLTTRSIPKQKTLFEEKSLDSERGKKLSAILDQVNHQYGTGTLRYAICGIKPSWAMRSEHKSPSYTTSWKELMKVRI